MMKLGNFSVMLLVMFVVLEFLAVPTGISSILETMGVSINPNTAQLVSADLESSSFFSQLFGATGIFVIVATTGAVIIGLFARSYDTSLVILPLIVFVGGLYVSSFWTIIQYVQTLGSPWLTNIIATIFIALGVGFLWSCVDYFAGR